MFDRGDILICKRNLSESLGEVITKGNKYRVLAFAPIDDDSTWNGIVIEDNNGCEYAFIDFDAGDNTYMWPYIYRYFYDESEVRELKLAGLLDK